MATRAAEAATPQPPAEEEAALCRCASGAKACCNKSDEKNGGRDCHFLETIRGTRENPNRQKMNQMRRDNTEYHNLEVRGDKNKYGKPLNPNVREDPEGMPPRRRSGNVSAHPAVGQGPKNGGIFQLDAQGNINPAKYKSDNRLTREGIELKELIGQKRAAWLKKYYRPECYTCDAQCKNHFTRMEIASPSAGRDTAEYSARALRQQQLEQAFPGVTRLQQQSPLPFPFSSPPPSDFRAPSQESQEQAFPGVTRLQQQQAAQQQAAQQQAAQRLALTDENFPALGSGGKTRKSKRRNKKNILKSKRMLKTKRKTKRLRKTRKNKKSKKSRKSRRRR